MGSRHLSIDGTRFRDSHNREFTFRGINVSGDSKLPRRPDQPSHEPKDFFDSDNLSFVGRPFTESEAHHHFAQLRKWGYNLVRYVFTWEALEHAGPGQYDREFIDHTIKILRIAKTYDLHVFMDPHQDVWSRYSGGSGAPLWTLYAAGLDPEAFNANQAAIVHNTSADPAKFPRMLWPTNYTRLAAETMFTLFYGGRDFAPNATINGQNIQDYLTDHFVNACKELAKAIHDAGDLEDECVIGWESMNEPNHGLIGWHDVSVFPEEVKMRKGTCPTPWQSFLTGSGRATEMDTYDFGSFGPYKSGRELVDPEGVGAWITDDRKDKKYGWKRGPNWKLGECLWAQHGIWDPKEDKLLLNDYFNHVPDSGTVLTYEVFTNTYFMPHFRKWRDGIRSVHKDCMILIESAVLEIPPNIKGTADDEKRLIFASHYYDGLTLLTKHWNTLYNVDVFGVMRGRYSSPVFAVKIGETAIRNCLRDQLEAIRLEGMKYLGEHPTLFTEIGIPFDMDDKHAYKTGDYSSQAAALDANHFALEGSGASGYTLWTYASSNNHEWGDNWNGEDLSIFSVDDTVPKSDSSLGLPPNLPSTNTSKTSIDKKQPSISSQPSSINPDNLKSTLRSPEITPTRSISSPDLSNTPGLRAAEAFIRPSPIATVGRVEQYGFDMRNCVFTFSLTSEKPTTEDLPTEIYLPDFHFPADKTSVEVSGGRWTIEMQDVDPDGGMQVLKWWHAAGDQNMTVRGVKRKIGGTATEDDEAGYFEMVRRVAMSCSVM